MRFGLTGRAPFRSHSAISRRSLRMSSSAGASQGAPRPARAAAPGERDASILRSTSAARRPGSNGACWRPEVRRLPARLDGESLGLQALQGTQIVTHDRSGKRLRHALVGISYVRRGIARTRWRNSLIHIMPMALGTKFASASSV